MRAYMGYVGDPSDGAVLVFAHNAKEARMLAWPACAEWTEGSYIDVRVKWLRREHLFLDADPVAIQEDRPHVIDNPTHCVRCELWGYPMNDKGICENCLDEIASNEWTK